MTPFRIGNAEVRYDTFIGITVVVLTMIVCTFIINRRLTLNAETVAATAAANRQVTLTILDKLNDEQEVAKELAAITQKNKELEVKLENNYEQLQECAANIERQARGRKAIQ